MRALGVLYWCRYCVVHPQSGYPADRCGVADAGLRCMAQVLPLMVILIGIEEVPYLSAKVVTVMQCGDGLDGDPDRLYCWPCWTRCCWRSTRR